MKRVKRTAISFLFLSVFINTISAQQVKIEIKNSISERAHLFSLSGEKLIPVDSINSAGQGTFIFSLSEPKHTSGFYRLSFDNGKWIDFINEGKDISIATDASSFLDSLKVQYSESNKLFYTFSKLNRQYKSKTELLQLILARYPKDDEYYQTTINKLTQIQNEYIEFINVTAQKNPLSFIAQYIKSAQLPVIDLSIPAQQQLSYLKSHALDNVDFNNSLMINSDLFTSKAIEYLTYYRNPQLPLELLEKEFMVAADSILNRAKINQIVYRHIVEYLIDGFKKFGFDKVLDYLVENYVIKDDLCLDVKTEGLIKRRIDQAKFFKIGTAVPNIVLTDNTGKKNNLVEILGEKTLIVFYASWCPHCKELLPKLESLYNKQKEKKFKVIAVSLDTNMKDWLSFVNGSCPSLVNVCDLKGWDGNAATDFFVYATPTMFLVDKELKLIKKPSTIEEVANF